MTRRVFNMDEQDERDEETAPRDKREDYCRPIGYSL
jgi:hypothetical protein